MFRKIALSVLLMGGVALANPYFDYAMCHYYIDNPQKAYPYCSKALKEMPTPSVFEDVISMYVRAHYIEGAIYVAKLYKDRYPELKRPYIDLYTLYTMNKNHEKAKEILEEAIQRFPKDSFFAINLITTYLHDGQIEKAEDILNKFLAFKNESEKYIFYYIRARIELAQQDKEKAIEDLKKAIELKPNFEEAIDTLANIYDQEGDYQKEQKLYEDILKKDPTNVSVLERLGNLFFKLGLSYKASDVFKKLTELNKGNPNYQYQYAVSLLQSMRYNKAISVLEPLYKNHPNNKAIAYIYGLALEAAHKPVKALDVYKKLLKIDSKNPKLYERIAGILIDEGKYNEAMPYIEKGLKLNPLSSKLYIFKAIITASHRHYIMAKVYADQSIKLNPHDYRSYFIRAMIEDKLHQIDNEIKDLKKVVALKPNDAEMLNYLGYTMLLYNKDIKEGLEYVKKAVKLSPKNPSYLDSLAYGYFLLHDYEKALQYEKEAYKLNPKDSVIIQHLGMIKLMLGDQKEAKRLLLEALHIVNKNGEEEPGQKKKILEFLKEIK
ncbi:tetratricopeptide repeat protein [Hydrogenobaculum acidophilum]